MNQNGLSFTLISLAVNCSALGRDHSPCHGFRSFQEGYKTQSYKYKAALPATVQSAAECMSKSSVEYDESIKKKDEEPTHNNKVHIVP